MHLGEDSHENVSTERVERCPSRQPARAESWQGFTMVSPNNRDNSDHRPQCSSTNDVGRPKPANVQPPVHGSTEATGTGQMEKLRSRAKGTAESKRHSWAARKQAQTIEDTDHSTGDMSFSRALSLDSGVMRHQDLHSGGTRGEHEPSCITITDSKEQIHEESSHDVSGDPSVVYRNGHLTSQTEIDVMTLSHNANRDYDQAKYITAPGVGSCNNNPTNKAGCCSCYNLLCSSSCSKCCSKSEGAHPHHCQGMSYFCANLFKHGQCSCKRKEIDSDSDDDIYIEDDPFRKRCLRAFLNFIYVLLALIAAVVTYSMIQDLITAMNNPVRSIHYLKVKDYDAPGKFIPSFFKQIFYL